MFYSVRIIVICIHAHNISVRELWSHAQLNTKLYINIISSQNRVNIYYCSKLFITFIAKMIIVANTIIQCRC